MPDTMSLLPLTDFFPSSLVFKLWSLHSSGSFLRSENKNKGLLFEITRSNGGQANKGSKHVFPGTEEKAAAFDLHLFCGQDGELLLAALDLCLLYLKGTFLEENFIYCDIVLGKRTSRSTGILLSIKYMSQDNFKAPTYGHLRFH